MSFVSHLESTFDGSTLPARTLQTIHGGKPLLVRYDLAAIAAATRRESLRDRAPDLWRYEELLPLEQRENRVSLGEGMTPLLDCPRLAERIGLNSLKIKDESQLPTGSFKARGMAMAVSLAKELGVTRVAAPTAGNAGGALAAYAARAGMEAWVFMPGDTPAVNIRETSLHGASTYLVDGLITDCGAIVKEGVERMGWFDMSTLREPYRIEGKKTMGLELAEQLDWKLPDVILYPTGGGTGLIGMWKAFEELEQIGWLDDIRRPRMISCQSSTCAPLPRAFAAGERESQLFEDARTVAAGLRVPKALGDFLVLDGVYESGGCAVAAEEDRLLEWMQLACELEGIALCPEAAACIGAIVKGLTEGWIQSDDRVVLFNTAAAQKYVELIDGPQTWIDHKAVDWSQISGQS
ncbi:MAG: threonine synthase [Planctomycetota bacterium]|jgi:threonine synthase|nr:threonine synthase [Planctomycetota bacterium]